MKRKKKLPRYWLGTRMPTSLGYQPNYGIGGQLMSSTPGLSLYPEIQTTKANIIPSALNKLLTTSSFAMDALKSASGFAPIVQNSARAGLHRAGLTAAQFVPDTLPVAGGHITSLAGKEVGKQVATKTGLGTLGTVMAGVGTAYGLTDMGMQIAANKDHRSAGLMRDTLNTNTYTTDLGNQYTTHGGVNLSDELDYAKALRTSRNLNFTAASIGTGMSAGALLGASVGSIAPGVGTAIGAGVGALGGLLAYGLGFGDTEKETKLAASDLADSVSMENKMSESLAKSLDAKQGFYGRTKSGSLSAANGKLPGYTRGKGVARLSGGEVVQLGGLKVEVPGKKNNKDEYVARKGTLLGEMISDPRSVVWTNKGGISDYIKNGGNESVALEAMNNMQMKYKNGKGYKCGKFPKYSFGTPAQTIAASVPHIGAILANWAQANRLNNSSTSTLLEPIMDLGASNIAYLTIGDQIDARPYIRMADQTIGELLYDNMRQVGYGHGGRMNRGVNLIAKGLEYKSNLLNLIQNQNLAQRNEGRQLAFKNALDARALYHDRWWRTQMEKLRKQGSLNDQLAQIPLNLYNVGSSWAKALSGIWLGDNALKIALNENEIYNKKVLNDANIAALNAKWLNAGHWLDNDQWNAYNEWLKQNKKP